MSNDIFDLFEALVESLEAEKTRADRNHNFMIGEKPNVEVYELEEAITQLNAIRRRLYG